MDDDPVPGRAPDPDADPSADSNTDPSEPPQAAEPATRGEVAASPAGATTAGPTTAGPMTAGPTGWVAPSETRGGGRSPVLVLVLGCAGILVLLFATSIVGLIFLGSQVSTVLDAAGSPPPGGTVNVFDLRVGDCLDQPAASADGTVVDLIRRDCAEAHALEVIAIVQVPGGPTYPGADAVSASADAQCRTAFTSYVGTTPEASIYDGVWYAVTEEGWQGGDRAIDCLAIADDESPMTGSVRGANR